MSSHTKMARCSAVSLRDKVDLPAAILPQSPMVMAATADADMQMLLTSVMNWQPRSYFSGGSLNPGASALSFGPGLLNLLSDARES